MFLGAPEFLRELVDSANRFLVFLDFAWQRPREADSPARLRQDLEERLTRIGLERERCRVLVFDPELEAWLFGDSPHVARVLGFGSPAEFRRLLQEANLWPSNKAKPPNPKRALEHALRLRKRPRSTAIYRAIARQVSLRPERCRDPTFCEFAGTLRDWFPTGRRS